MSEDAYYLTVNKDNKAGGLIAVITLGQPQLGDQNVHVCSVSRQPSVKAAKRWYREQLKTKPWETRQ